MPYASVLHALRALIATPMIEQSPGFLGEPAPNVSVCVHALLPNLVGAIVHLGTATIAGRDALLDMLNSSGVDAELPVADVAGRFSGGAATDALMKSGSGMLHELLGPRLALMNEAVAGKAGIGAGSGAALLAMATPFALGLIKRELREGRTVIGAPELTALLDEQKPHLRGHLSERFFELLGVADTARWLASGHPGVVPGAPFRAVEGMEHEKGSWVRWLPAIVLLVIALLVLGYCMKRTPDQNSDSGQPASTVAAQASSDATASGTSAASAASATPDAASGAASSNAGASNAGASDVAASSSGPANAAASGAAASGAAASGTTAGDVAAGNAAASDAAASDAVAQSTPGLVVHFGYGEASVRRGFVAQAKPMLAYAKAHPDARFSVSGFADSSGDAALNEKLANRRAQALMDALQRAGIPSSRLELKQAQTVSASGSGREARRAQVHVMQ